MKVYHCMIPNNANHAKVLTKHYGYQKLKQKLGKWNILAKEIGEIKFDTELDMKVIKFNSFHMKGWFAVDLELPDKKNENQTVLPKDS